MDNKEIKNKDLKDVQGGAKQAGGVVPVSGEFTEVAGVEQKLLRELER